MASLPSPLLSPEQYLELDSRSDRPSEYYDGVMYQIEATTANHSRIQGNLSGYLRQIFRKTPCESLGPTIRVLLPNKRYAYPDILVVCGKISFDDKAYQTVLNPGVIIEVLSPSTEDFDRGGKADLYRGIASLKEYVIVAQDRILVQRYTRTGERQWTLREFSQADEVLRLDSVNVDIPLSEIYERVEFEPEQ